MFHTYEEISDGSYGVSAELERSNSINGACISKHKLGTYTVAVKWRTQWGKRKEGIVEGATFTSSNADWQYLLDESLQYSDGIYTFRYLEDSRDRLSVTAEGYSDVSCQAYRLPETIYVSVKK